MYHTGWSSRRAQAGICAAHSPAEKEIHGVAAAGALCSQPVPLCALASGHYWNARPPCRTAASVLAFWRAVTKKAHRNLLLAHPPSAGGRGDTQNETNETKKNITAMDACISGFAVGCAVHPPSPPIFSCVQADATSQPSEKYGVVCWPDPRPRPRPQPDQRETRSAASQKERGEGEEKKTLKLEELHIDRLVFVQAALPVTPWFGHEGLQPVFAPPCALPWQTNSEQQSVSEERTGSTRRCRKRPSGGRYFGPADSVDRRAGGA